MWSPYPILLLLLCSFCWAEIGPVVQTKYGKVKGKYVDQAQVFKSIPFAGPVSGSNRWKDPQPPVAWLGTLDGTADPPACPQDCRSHGCSIPNPEVMDEECLFLNVYTPQNASPESNLPVLVFIHGGAYVMGSSTVAWYDGSYLAVHSNIVVVTANYRLGALGFLVYGSGSETITGNFGIKDQLLALQWVQDNIRQFGGDPTQVTLSGESAGAQSVSIHMTNMQTSGLFHKAIIQSDPFTAEYKPVTQSLKNGKEFARALGCATTGDPECLRSKDIREIVDASQTEGLHWAPVTNGAEVAGHSLSLFQSGHFRSEVPVIMGTTGAEAVSFVYHFMKEKVPKCVKYGRQKHSSDGMAMDSGEFRPCSSYLAGQEYHLLLDWHSMPVNLLVEGLNILQPASVYRAALTIFFGSDNVDKALKIYPAPSDGQDIRPQISEIITDSAFYCPTVLSAKSVHHHSPSTPVYFYIFNHSLPQPRQGMALPIKIPECYTEACHEAELPFVFHTPEHLFGYTPEELYLADSISQYWGNFVKYGNPNGQSAEQGEGYCIEEECKGAVEWPQFSNSTNWNSLSFETPENRVESNYRHTVCDTLNAFGHETDIFTHELSVFYGLFQIASMAHGANRQ